VLVNLLLNAADATPAGGEVKVMLRVMPTTIELEVQDNGPGIPVELRERVFEPFFTTKGAGRGTGLGLAVCRSIVDRHHGTIRLSESESGGCRFVVALPLATSEATWMPHES
jgi:signal transduction histidine kinase